MPYCVSRPGFFRTPHCSTIPPRTGCHANVSPRNSSLCWQFGEFRAQEPFLPPSQWISDNILQWKDRYSIPLGSIQAPSACMNLTLNISTTSSLSSHGRSTRTVQEKVHSFPLARKPLSFPWFRRNLLVFLGSVFSCVSNMFISLKCILLWTFSHPTQLHLSLFSTVVGSPVLPVHSLELAISTIPCRDLQPNCKNIPCCGLEQEQLVNTAPLPELRLLKFSLGPAASSKVEMLFEVPFCTQFLLIAH